MIKIKRGKPGIYTRTCETRDTKIFSLIVNMKDTFPTSSWLVFIFYLLPFVPFPSLTPTH